MLGLGVAAGCGGGGTMTYRDSGTTFPEVSTLGTGGAAGGSAAAGGAGGSAKPGGSGGAILGGSGGSGTGNSDGGTAFPDAAAPAPTNLAIWPGTSIVLGPGLSCSHAPTPAAGAMAPDKWCGIVRPGATQDIVALYVVNITKAVGGAAITCTASDANCLQLSADLSTSSDASHGFYGQTLIYYDKAAAYAWRPGWPAGRKLLGQTDTQPAFCAASSKDVTTAICTQDDVTGTTTTAYAGSIAMPTGGLLPPIEAIGTGSIAFSPDALGVLYSVNTDANSVTETLKMQTIGDDASRKTVAMGIAGWSLSSDGMRWFWFSALSASTIGGSKITTGTLQTAPYPAGTSPVNVQGKTLTYSPYGAKGVVSLSTPTSMGTDLKAVTDVDNPTTTTVVLQAKNVVDIADIDTMGNVVYVDDVFFPDMTDNTHYLTSLRAIMADGTKKCAVSADAAAIPGGSGILTSGKGVAWVQVLFDPVSGMLSSITGLLTTLADCVQHMIAPEIVSYVDTTTGLVIQNGADSNQNTADLSFVPLSGAGVPGALQLLQGAADPPFEVLTPEMPRVLFSVRNRAAGNGIYASAPFVAGPPLVAPVGRTISVTRPASAGLLPSLGGRGVPSISATAPALAANAERFSPFKSRVDLNKGASRRASQGASQAAWMFPRLSVPAALRRPAAP